MVAFWMVIVFIGPSISPYHEADILDEALFIKPGSDDPYPATDFQPPSKVVWLGSDYLGRDTLSRTLFGARTTIGISLASTLLAYVVGITLGIAAAVGGTLMDSTLSRVNDAFLSIPSIMMALVVIAAIGSTIPILIILTGLIYATTVFRIARSLGLEVVVSDFVEAARVRGEGLWWIITREVLPNVAMPMATDFGLRFVYVILFISSLSFLGLGVQPAAVGLGQHGQGESRRASLRFHRAARAGACHRHLDDRDQPHRRRRLRPRRRPAGQEDDLMPALLEVDRLKIDARKDDDSLSPIVKSVSFNVERGEVMALIGESGSGKTTIALSALGYAKPGLEFTSGEVRLDGRDVISMPPDEQRALRGQRVAYLAQSAAATFNPALTIGEQVTESPILHGQLSREEAERRAEELYRALELPDPERLGRRYPHQVSGGQLQRLMAAMALCGNPDLLILDEPTTALDVTTQIEVLKAFKSVIQQEGAAAIYVTHDLSVVAQIADHIVVLYAGDIQERGTADQIINRPSHDYTRRLMAAVRPPPAAGQGEETSDAHRREAPALEMKNVTAGYGRGAAAVKVLRDVNVTIQRGHTVGVIGESGCGKSTLARVMSGLLPAGEGEVLLDGQALQPSLRQRARSELQKVQFVFQMADTALNPRQRIDHILGRPLEFYLGLKGAEKRARIGELLHMVELPPEFAGRYPEELSGGQKQRVNLARALAASPEVLLCDEVISALDTIVGANVIELLERLRKQTGVSFVFISHDLSTIASFADQVVVLYAGRVVEQGRTDQVLSPPYHPYTRLLIASVPELRIGWLEETMQTQEAQAGIDRVVKLVEVGCPFFDRCPISIEGTCDRETPPIRTLGRGHAIECHRSEAEFVAAS